MERKENRSPNNNQITRKNKWEINTVRKETIIPKKQQTQ